MTRTELKPWIRWAIRGDLREMVAIERASFGSPLDAAALDKLLATRNTIGLVAEKGDITVGHIIYRLHRDRIELIRLAVAPAWRRKGVGRALLTRLAGKLDRKRARIEVVVPDDHLDAHLWLRACGWSATEVLRGHGEDGEDAYVFTFVREA